MCLIKGIHQTSLHKSKSVSMCFASLSSCLCVRDVCSNTRTGAATSQTTFSPEEKTAWWWSLTRAASGTTCHATTTCPTSARKEQVRGGSQVEVWVLKLHSFQQDRWLDAWVKPGCRLIPQGTFLFFIEWGSHVMELPPLWDVKCRVQLIKHDKILIMWYEYHGLNNYFHWQRSEMTGLWDG